MSKVQVEIKVRVNGKEVWRPIEKVMQYVYPDKIDIKGKMPSPYSHQVKTFFESVDEDIIKIWSEAYPSVDIQSELLKAKAWLLSTPSKSKKNFKSFVNNWLSRAMNNVRGSKKESIEEEWGKFK